MATKTIEIREGSVEEFRSDAGVLLVDHFCEVARDAGVRKLNPDWEMFETLEGLERLMILLAYQDNQCVGYCVSVLMAHSHNKHQLQLHNDTTFVHPSVRKSGVGLELMRCMEEIADDHGADCVWIAPTHSKLDQVMARRSEYVGTHTIYSRRAK